MTETQMTDQDLEAGIEYWYGRACRVERQAAGVRITLRETEQALAEVQRQFVTKEGEAARLQVRVAELEAVAAEATKIIKDEGGPSGPLFMALIRAGFIQA